MSSTGNSAGANAGAPKGGRVRDSANSGARVQAVHTGLKKVVTGRESVIKEQAVKLAEKLDVKTDGRHHQKIRLALLALNSLVDTLGRDGTAASEKKSSARAEGTDPAGNSERPTTTSASSDEPEDIGTFTAKGNRPAK
ncbi:hypothetical protein [Pseudoclavibacter terrae]|uniref:Uncharacterized protein n=1 Tax=Pseudoclavibacter terrae TaxID=1530195 RepID=A0A7J5B3I6_9MICO|nr:hypothetical protein [Pseudoclavibacter terrae]KAB1638491.1 hypothetical protein F8O03_08875 [Pseudoclavibacter terrae]